MPPRTRPSCGLAKAASDLACEAARNYASAKWHAVSSGADMLLAYSEAKRAIIEMIVVEARV